jgi:hypothetical protein
VVAEDTVTDEGGGVQVVASALKGRLQHWPQSLQLPAQQKLELGYFDAPGASETARCANALT